MPTLPDPARDPLNASPSRPSRRKLWIGSVIALVGVLALGGLAWTLTHKAPAAGASAAGGSPGGRGGPGGPGGGRRAPATTVGVATAQKIDIPIVFEALGTVTPAGMVTVRPQVSGVLRKIAFSEGQMVKAGQLLAEIDPRPFELALQQAIGQRQRDEAQLANAKVTLSRYRVLLGQDSIARQDVDTQAALVQQFAAALVIDRASEGTARLNLGYCRVVAPISGRLGLRTVDIGDVVGPGDSGGIAVIAKLAPIDVEFALPQDRLPELQTRLTDAGGAPPAIALDRTRSITLAQGKFLALDNSIDTQTGTVRAKARFANENGALFPNQFVNLRLEVRTIEGAVVVPVSALRHANDGDFVWALDAAEHTVSLRRVTRGVATVDTVQVTSGLQAGEQVITEGGDRLKDGARVTLPGESPPAGAASGPRRGPRPAGAASAASAAGSASSPRHHRRASDPAS
ncbi:MAG: efflux RND transporter periplasmic adaptor subunit [Ideonella sp.]